uniref:thioredoxin-dependent peroxiredoxin n=1 Tax=Timspurckia oligopyrenoides TaxID=708627 RepID=A0A7S0ZEP6_9RHOD|mmetsp:Transcript_2217/g.3914  ORF Transcript_2217/g.3914 Transcript_2217/m.3914 type:complete len:129 (+) Transcript_2217:347-733(+)
MSSTPISVGDVAPDFTSTSQSNTPWTLSSVTPSKHVVLYSYPKDDTPGCTEQACKFNDSIELFDKLDAAIVGVSADADHSQFINKYGLKFTLLSDTKNEFRQLYGVPKTLGIFLVDVLMSLKRKPEKY